MPQFWEWLQGMGENGLVKMPFEIQQEIAISTGPLGHWINSASAKKALILDEEADQNLLEHVLDTGYGPNLNDSELEKIGQDPFLVAYALADPKVRVVVTKETSAPSKQRANRRIPDVCHDVGITWMKDFDFYRALKFTTK